MDYTEDTLVQQTTAEYLEANATCLIASARFSKYRFAYCPGRGNLRTGKLAAIFEFWGYFGGIEKNNI